MKIIQTEDGDLPPLERIKNYTKKNKKKVIWEVVCILLLLGLILMYVLIPGVAHQVTHPQTNEPLNCDFTKVSPLSVKEKTFPQGTPVPLPAPLEVVEQLVFVAQPQRTSVSYSGGCEQWRGIVSQHFPADQVNNALAVMNEESGGNPNAQNWEDAKITGYPSMGLMQINGPTNWAWNDPEANIARAAEMFSRRFWAPWPTAKKLGL